MQQRRRQRLHRPVLQTDLLELEAKILEPAGKQLADLGSKHELCGRQHRIHRPNLVLSSQEDLTEVSRLRDPEGNQVGH